MVQQPFFSGRGEALLCAGWLPTFLVGFAIATLVSPFGSVLIVVAFIEVLALVTHVSRRLAMPRRDRRVLWSWLTQKAQYRAWRYLIGRPVPPDST